MRRENAAVRYRRTSATAKTPQRLVSRQIALVACDGLDVAARTRCPRCHIYLVHEQGNFQKLRQLFRKTGIGVGVFPTQPMVHMQHAKRADKPRFVQFARHIGKRRGIRPT